jgi:uncharacterized small protein (DUF1192 family)
LKKLKLFLTLVSVGKRVDEIKNDIKKVKAEINKKDAHKLN